MSRQSSIQSYDRDKIFDSVVNLFQERTDWHGFRSRTELAERFDQGEISWIHKGGEIVCAASYRHRQTSHTRVYFTAMDDDAWNPESWSQMITGILLESPHDRIISKTPPDSRETDLWDSTGIQLREEEGLMVWEVLDNTAMEQLEGW